MMIYKASRRYTVCHTFIKQPKFFALEYIVGPPVHTTSPREFVSVDSASCYAKGHFVGKLEILMKLLHFVSHCL